jgi:carboxypeptidase D
VYTAISLSPTMRACTLAVAATFALSAHAFVSQRDMLARQRAASAARIEARAADKHKHKYEPGTGVKNITFSNPKASRAYDVRRCLCAAKSALDFWVNGSAIPEVKFDIGPSWAGLLPISNKTGETRQVYIWVSRLGGVLIASVQLFFWFFPPGPEGSLDDLIFWTNGGVYLPPSFHLSS